MYNEAKMKDFGRLIGELTRKQHLTRVQAKECYRQILLSEQPELQQGAFLAAHQAKGPTVAEIAGALEAVTEFDTLVIEPDIPEPACDIVGTGSDALKTINVSSPVAPIVSACGVYVAKKGAQRVTGVAGASDIYGALGLDLQAPLDKARVSIEQNGLGYLAGEKFLLSGWGRLVQHMRFTSIFNIIGPLTQPCRATQAIVLGVYDKQLGRMMVEIAREIGLSKALTMYGTSEKHDARLGIDEISLCGPSFCWELKDGKIEEYVLTPQDFGVKQAPYEEVASKGSVQENAQAISQVLAGQDEGPLRDFLAINAAVALKLMGRTDNLPQATDLARQALATGQALAKLNAMIQTQGSA